MSWHNQQPNVVFHAELNESPSNMAAMTITNEDPAAFSLVHGSKQSRSHFRPWMLLVHPSALQLNCQSLGMHFETTFALMPFPLKISSG
jgi:hypothetical protein